MSDQNTHVRFVVRSQESLLSVLGMLKTGENHKFKLPLPCRRTLLRPLSFTTWSSIFQTYSWDIRGVNHVWVTKEGKQNKQLHHISSLCLWVAPSRCAVCPERAMKKSSSHRIKTAAQIWAIPGCASPLARNWYQLIGVISYKPQNLERTIANPPGCLLLARPVHPRTLVNGSARWKVTSNHEFRSKPQCEFCERKPKATATVGANNDGNEEVINGSCMQKNNKH